MSWIKFWWRGGVVKIKPRWQMRSIERERRVRVFSLGPIIVSWWGQDALIESNEYIPADLILEARKQARHSKPS